MQLKVERSDGWKDDTALNGIKLLCSKLGNGVPDHGIHSKNYKAITSSVGPWGQWKTVFYCSDADNSLNLKTTAMIGFQLKVEQPKGHRDDTGANNFRMICSDFSKTYFKQFQIEGDGTKWGEWTDVQVCKHGYAACGIVTQVEKDGGKNRKDILLSFLRCTM
jgi:hypothetical protein